MYCMEPSEPSCITRYGTFDDEVSFSRCRREVEQFVSNMTDYRNCLVQNHNESIDHVDRVIDRFNCRAQGRSFCR